MMANPNELTTVHLTIEFTEPILGTVPHNQGVYDILFGSGGDDPGLRGGAPTPEMAAEEREAVPVEVEGERPGWTGFYSDDDGPFLFDYQVMGYIKDKGNLCKDLVGVKNLRSKIDQAVYVHPRKIRPIWPGDVQGAKGEPDLMITRPLRAMTAQGPRVTVVRSDAWPIGTRLAFEVQIYPAFAGLDATVLAEIFALGEQHGLGQWRNGGWGRFRVTQFDVDQHAPRAVNPVLAAWLRTGAAEPAAKPKRGRKAAAEGEPA